MLAKYGLFWHSSQLPIYKDKMYNNNTDKTTIAVLLIILTTAMSAISGTLMKLTGPDITVYQKVFFKTIPSIFFTMLIAKKHHVSMKVKKEAIFPLILRCLLGAIAIGCSYYAIDHMKISDATMLIKTAPVFTALFSFIILKEKYTIIHVCSYAIAIIGALFIIKPSMTEIIPLPTLVAMATAIAFGLSLVMLRIVGKKGVLAETSSIYLNVTTAVIMFFLMITDLSPMRLWQLLCLLLVGFFTTIFHLALAQAYIYAPASKISIFEYLQLLFAGLLGYFVFQEIPDRYSFIGYALICGAAFWLYLFNKHEQKKLRTLG